MPITRQQILQIFSSHWLPKIANVIILALFSWWAVVYVLPLFDEKEKIVAPKSIEKETIAPAKISLHNLDLFGTPEKALSQNKAANAKQTKLNLTLRGILAIIDDPSQGYAQIENAKKDERYFSVRDKIFGLATLEEIYIDRVIILHNGKYETLLLPEEFLDNKHFMAAQLKKEQKEIVSLFRDSIVNYNTEDLADLFGFDEVYKNAGFYGFAIEVLGEKGQKMLDKLGGRQGDIIVSVNGDRFADGIEAVQNLTKLKDAKNINVEVDRGGTIIFLNFDFDKTTVGQAAK